MRNLFSKFKNSFSKMTSHPVAVTSVWFGLLVSSSAIVDFNRNIDVSEEEKLEFKPTESEHLGEALEKLHSKAFFQEMSYDAIKFNRNRSIELFFLYKRAVKLKLKLKNDELFHDKPDSQLEEIAAAEYYIFCQNMCRRAMIRNGYLIKWLKALLQDEVVKFYVIPLISFFGVRYYKEV